MSRVVRHDTITLSPEAEEDDFLRFMNNELIPFFSDRYQGPTRASIADLKGQSLLRDAKQTRRFIWITIWDGNADSVRGAAFQHARMIPTEATGVMLTKLESFGKRGIEKVYGELISIKVATNK